MLRKAMFSAAAALSIFSVANVEASDRFSLGLNFGGSYPVYQPAPVIVNPYPSVHTPNYGYGSSYGYASPGVSFNYSNHNAYRPVRSRYDDFRRPVRNHGHHHHHCW